MNTQITDWPLQKQDEVAAVAKYLKNEGIDFQMTLENIDIAAEEPTDVWVRDIDKRFQVVVANPELYDGLGRADRDENGVKMFESGGNRDYVWRQTILMPLEKKSKYGKAAKGNILLIRPPFDPPWWVEADIKNMRATGRHQDLSVLFFDDIYLVLSGKNIKIFP